MAAIAATAAAMMPICTWVSSSRVVVKPDLLGNTLKLPIGLVGLTTLAPKLCASIANVWLTPPTDLIFVSKDTTACKRLTVSNHSAFSKLMSKVSITYFPSLLD